MNFRAYLCAGVMETSLYFKAALVADARSLASHWIYGRARISALHTGGGSAQPGEGRPADQATPTDGTLTHLGEQTVWLKEALDEAGGRFDADCWRARWLAGMRDYRGHIDAASSQTLENDGLWPSRSDDLGGVARIAPLLDLDQSEEETIRAARCQTAFTHGDPGAADAAEFFVRAVFAIRSGVDISRGLFLAAAGGDYRQLDAGELLAVALSTDPEDPEGTARELGTMGGIPEAFPLALYLAERPETDFRAMIEDNVRAGGETSARAMLLALLFAARDGTAVLDAGLLDRIDKREAKSGEPGTLVRTA